MQQPGISSHILKKSTGNAPERTVFFQNNAPLITTNTLLEMVTMQFVDTGYRNTSVSRSMGSPPSSIILQAFPERLLPFHFPGDTPWIRSNVYGTEKNMLISRFRLQEPWRRPDKMHLITGWLIREKQRDIRCIRKMRPVYPACFSRTNPATEGMSQWLL